MKTFLRLVLLTCFVTGLNLSMVQAASDAKWVSLDGMTRSAAVDEGFKLVSNREDGIDLSFRFSGLESFNVQTRMGTFSRISVPGFAYSNRIGEPALPLERRIIAVPLGAEVIVEAARFDRSEIKLTDHSIEYPLMPAQPSLSKSQRPEDVPFEYKATAYSRNSYDDHPLVTAEELGIMRGLRLFVITVEPVKYNPEQKTLAVYNNIEIAVHFNGGDYIATRDMHTKTYSPYFESIYSQSVLNYRRDSSLDEDLTRYPIKYVIISHSMFAAQLAPFVDWKRKQGYNVIVAYKGEPAVGSTATSIKAYLQGLYDAGTTEDPAPSFVLFVGDTAQIPVWSGVSSHYTDLTYVRLAGSDYMPEIYFGRFSARTTDELQPQIDKTLEYERYEMPDPSYLGRCVMIAGVDADNAPTYGNGQINYGTTYYFNTAHGLTSNTYLYPESGSSDALVLANASEGRGYMNYTAHGSSSGWADPSFSVSDVANMTNAHKYGTMVGNCCLTSKFDVANCFAEALLRAENKGAIGYIGGTNNSYWDEDYWWGVGAKAVAVNPVYDAAHRGAYDGMFHDHSETFPNWYTTQYGFIMAGNIAVVEGNSSRINYYWEIYSLMGDPSLTTYLGVPTANTVSYPDPIFIGQTSFTVTANPYSYVGFSSGGQLLAAGLVGTSGSLTLNYAAITAPGYAHIVITRQGRIPVIDSIQVIPNSGPYVVTSAEVINDAAGGNGNGLADFGETLDLTLTEENVGTVSAAGVNVTLSTVDPYLTFTDATESYGTILSGQSATITNGFEAVVATNVPDGHVIAVVVTATDNASNEWTDGFNITAHAPEITVGTVTVHDPSGNNNGRLDPGESATLDVNLTNNGSALVVNLAALLSSADPYVVITDNSGSLASLAAGATDVVTFAVTIDTEAPIGHAAPFHVDMTGTNYATTGSFSLAIGLVLEDFETGNFTRFPWTPGGNLPWTITSTDPQEGVYCAKSGTITHSDTSDLSVTVTILAADTIRFYYKVSSESGYDYLRFYIDGAQQAQWSGTVAWTQAAFAVTAGNHTFLWRYLKDGSLSSGSDCAWLDYIIFPPIAPIPYPDISVNPALFEVGLDPEASTTRTLALDNIGQADLIFSASATTNSTRLAAIREEYPDLILAKDQADPRHGSRTLDNQGGPDTFGYRWYDSNEAGGPVYNWVEIAGIGTRLNTTGDDEHFGVTLPWGFPLYGTTYTAARISSNGILHFSGDTTDYGNREIPSGRLPNAMLAPLWDDLSPQNGAGIYYYNDATNSRFIVQWDSIPHFGTTYPGLYTFEAILYSSGEIFFQYQSVSGTVNNLTIGIENATGTDGLQVVYNAAYLVSNLAIRFTAVQPWLRVSPTSGTVNPSGSTPLTVTFDATGLAADTYTGQISITSNDPDETVVTVPVTMIVGVPNAVTDLSIQVSGADVILRWSAVPNATSYNVYASNDPSSFIEAPIATVSATTCTITNEADTYLKRFYLVTSAR